MADQIQIRPIIPADEPFVFSVWLRGLRQCLPYKRMRTDPFFRHAKPIMLSVYERATTLIAVYEGDPTTILGCIVFEPELIHWLFVKESLRSFGIGSHLVEASGVDLRTVTTTAWNDETRRLLDRFPDATYNPFLFTERK
jgi:GNAT superfamily N-acetyltransferase